jgi:hypothetical protein
MQYLVLPNSKYIQNTQPEVLSKYLLSDDYNFTPRWRITQWHIAEVAASQYFINASNGCKNNKILITRGKAAILAICSLYAANAIGSHFILRKVRAKHHGLFQCGVVCGWALPFKFQHRTLCLLASNTTYEQTNFSEKTKKLAISVSLSAKAIHRPKGWRFFCCETAKNVPARFEGTYSKYTTINHELFREANT